MTSERVSGILLHITSLPSYGGIGDFGPAAFAFVDFLATGKQRLWQVLPLNPTGYGSSPYSALSAFAGNPLLISLERLVDAGWLTPDRIKDLPGHNGPCDFERAFEAKRPLIEEAAANFLDRASGDERARFQRFAQDNISWLTDWAMFAVLRHRFDYAGWINWPADYAFRQPDAMTALLNESGRDIAIEQVIQFFFAEQWASLRSYCTERKIKILGDVAIFVSYDSADVWTHPEIFELDERRQPTRVSGVPPDYFSATGQRWGNPLYKWALLEERGLRLVGRAHSPLARPLRPHPPRPLPRLRSLLVHRRRRANRRKRSLGQISRPVALQPPQRDLRRSPLRRRRPRPHHPRGRRASRILRHARHAHPAVRLC